MKQIMRPLIMKCEEQSRAQDEAVNANNTIFYPSYKSKKYKKMCSRMQRETKNLTLVWTAFFLKKNLNQDSHTHNHRGKFALWNLFSNYSDWSILFGLFFSRVDLCWSATCKSDDALKWESYLVSGTVKLLNLPHTMHIMLVWRCDHHLIILITAHS